MPPKHRPGRLAEAIHRAEAAALAEALAACGNDRTRAAEYLGVNRRSLYKLLDRHPGIAKEFAGPQEST